LINRFNTCFTLSALFYLLLFFLSAQLPLFHDNILFSSKIPDHFFQNGFFAFPLPANIDTGYGPVWSWYISAGWHFFGKSLWVNHLLCLPVLIAAAWFYLKIAIYFLTPQYLWVALVLLFLEPTYLAQSTMASLDVFVVMAFLGGLYSIIHNKKYLLILLCIMLAMLSVRGAILVFVLFINQFIFNYYQHQKIHLKLILPYLIPAAFFMFWLLLHFQQTGFFLVREGSSWAEHHHLANFKQLLNNFKYTVWIFLDFGRLFLQIPFFLIWFILIWKRKTIKPNAKVLLWWCFWPAILLTVVLCVRTNPILHRYFIVCFLLISITAVYFLSNYLKKKHFNFLLVIVFAGLISGHFWIYPDRLAQGWDASLAHLPYYKLRSKMIAHLTKKNIDYSKVTASFPMYNSTYYTDFTDNKNKYLVLHKSKLLESEYVIYSNVCNDFSVEDINLLRSKKFVLQKALEAKGVKMELYKRR